MLDIARESQWPSRYTGRTLRNAFFEQWRDRETELAGSKEVIAAYREAEGRGDMRAVAVWASEAIDLINESQSAADIVHRIAGDAEAILSRILDVPNSGPMQSGRVAEDRRRSLRLPGSQQLQSTREHE